MSNTGFEGGKTCIVTVHCSVLPMFNLQIYGFTAEELNADNEKLGTEIVHQALRRRGLMEFVDPAEISPARPLKFFGTSGRPRL